MEDHNFFQLLLLLLLKKVLRTRKVEKEGQIWQLTTMFLLTMYICVCMCVGRVVLTAQWILREFLFGIHLII
jgi:hypothetical protein